MDSVITNIYQNFGKRKICSLFVPHSISDEQEETRIYAAQDFIERCEEYLTFLQTTDDSCFYQYDTESKWQAMEWCAPGSKHPKKRCLRKYRISKLLIAFFDSNFMLHQDFVPQGQTVNAEFYETILKRLLLRI